MQLLAEEAGFEPATELPLCHLSRVVPSTSSATRPNFTFRNGRIISHVECVMSKKAHITLLNKKASILNIEAFKLFVIYCNYF